MVFNFPQRYLYFPIYISFVRNCLAPLSPSTSTNYPIRSWCRYEFILSFFFHFFSGSFKNCGLSHLHIVNLFTVRSLKFDCPRLKLHYWHIEIQLTVFLKFDYRCTVKCCGRRYFENFMDNYDNATFENGNKDEEWTCWVSKNKLYYVS